MICRKEVYLSVGDRLQIKDCWLICLEHYLHKKPKLKPFTTIDDSRFSTHRKFVSVRKVPEAEVNPGIWNGS